LFAFDLRDDAATSQQTSGYISVEDELSRYKSLRVPAASTSALLYWKEQAIDYSGSSNNDTSFVLHLCQRSPIGT